MGLQAGRLRNRITIRRMTDVSDGKGGYNRGWANVVTDLPAEVVSQNGREAFVGQSLLGISTYRIIIRWRDGVRTADQILYGSEELNIKLAADPDGRREALVILADTESPQNAGEA